MGQSVCLYYPANFLVMPYSCFIFPWADASSASFTRFSMKFPLSVFTLFLTALFASVCCSWAVAFAARVRLLLIAPFSFPSSLALYRQCLRKSQNFAACGGPHLFDWLTLCIYVHVTYFKKVL